ncbi:hypothetical protein [Planosporangium thailandense]
MRATATMLALVAAAGTVTACGSSAKASGGATAASSAPGQGGFQAYMTCLSQHGVTLPSAFPRGNRPSGRPSVRPTDRPSDRPSGGFGGRFGFGNQPPAGVDAQTWQNAQQACSSLRPSGGPRNGANSGAFTAYRNCLADHGVTMSAGPNGLATSDPKVAAAMKVCEPLRPTGRPQPSPTA